MIIYQNKQDKSGDNKIIQKQNDFCSWKLQSEKVSGHLPPQSLIIEKSERAKRAGNFFWWFYCINDILSEKVRIVKVRKKAKIRNLYNQGPHLTQDTTWESNKTTINITNKSQEVSPFPAGDHKAAMNRCKAWQSQDINNTMIQKRSTALKRSVKLFYWRA